MPYKNVHYIKLMLELLDDPRFIKECNDSQKLDYILWLCMAGLTQNNSPNDPKWFKTRFNLNKETAEIEVNIRFLKTLFPKMFFQRYKNKDVIKFSNFKKLHNPIGKSQGTPREILGSSQNIIEYNRIIIEYNRIKYSNKAHFTSSDYKRFYKACKNLFIKASKNTSLILECVGWVSKQGYTDWTLETCFKKWDDFILQRGSESYRKLKDKYDVK